MTTTYSMTINGNAILGEKSNLQVLNPATEEVIGMVPQASKTQLDNAVAAAATAFQTWKNTSHQERKNLIATVADTIESYSEELANIIVQEQGKPLDLARMEVGGTVAWTRYASAMDVPVQVIEESESKRIEIHHKPIGVVASITPWNWPLMIAAWHIMPALRAGNTVVIKPSEYTSVNTLRLIQIMNEVLPEGVINVVAGGAEIGHAMSAHPSINKIIFTGSTATGQKIMKEAACNLKRITLELGGNDAGIVLPDSDIDAIAQGLFQTAFINMGQTCAALKRLYVHDSQYDEVCEKLAVIARQQVVGNGADSGVTFGPLQNEKQRNIVSELVEDAKQQGAYVWAGGELPDGAGFFYPPTIVSNVTNGHRIVDEEQFGPVLPIIRYSTIEEAIQLANDSSVGLGGSVWSSDIEKAQKVAQQLECGTVWINNHAEVLPHVPFGGVKMSGMGVEFGMEGLLENTVPQVVSINK